MVCSFCKRPGHKCYECYHKLKRFGTNNKSITKTRRTKFVKSWKHGKLHLETKSKLVKHVSEQLI